MLGKKYIYTSKKTSLRAIMSTILGMISDVSLGIVIYRAYLDNGETMHSYGMTALLALLFALVGISLGIVTVRDKDNYQFFPVLGILLNIIALCVVALILQFGQGLM